MNDYMQISTEGKKERSNSLAPWNVMFKFLS